MQHRVMKSAATDSINLILAVDASGWLHASICKELQVGWFPHVYRDCAEERNFRSCPAWITTSLVKEAVT